MKHYIQALIVALLFTGCASLENFNPITGGLDPAKVQAAEQIALQFLIIENDGDIVAAQAELEGVIESNAAEIQKARSYAQLLRLISALFEPTVEH